MTVLYQEPYNHKVPYVSQKNPFYQFHVGIICSNEFQVNVHDKRYSGELRISYFQALSDGYNYYSSLSSLKKSTDQIRRFLQLTSFIRAGYLRKPILRTVHFHLSSNLLTVQFHSNSTTNSTIIIPSNFLTISAKNVHF